ncbi:protein shisa-5-like [Chironomus tepperi]|uniref:protein shisa-5-like n=1 Tax=Chironomus tepperi TaxID=113505 RepID=UPI00391F20E6
MDFFFFVFIAFTTFVLCSLCGFCCRKKESGAIYSTPVVVTSETHQVPSGNVYAQQTTITTNSTPYQNPQMPMPYPAGNAAPYPPAGNVPPYPQPQPMQPYPPVNAGSPYPPQAPYGQPGAPYPPVGYPPQPVMPPTYNEAVMHGGPGYQKQEAYNPSYPGN